MRDLALKGAVLIIIAVLLVIPLQAASAQEITLAQKANQKSIEVHISKDGNVGILHIVEESSAPRQIDLIQGAPDNIKVTEIGGGQTQYAMINGDLGVMFLPSTAERIVQYDLDNALVQEQGLWKWEFRYLESTKFFFPENINMIFVDGQPVLLDEKKAINCHGCEMVLEFFEDQDIQVVQVNWKQYEFELPIISPSEIKELEFDQPSKSISFVPSQTNQLITVVLPFELLWEPYQVYQGDEKIPLHSYIKNDTHVWLNVRSDSMEPITIIGTTVIPEFSLFLPLVLGVAVIVSIQYRTILR